MTLRDDKNIKVVPLQLIMSFLLNIVPTFLFHNQKKKTFKKKNYIIHLYYCRKTAEINKFVLD